MTVDYATADGSATAPGDYAAASRHAHLHRRARPRRRSPSPSTATRSSSRTRRSSSTCRTRRTRRIAATAIGTGTITNDDTLPTVTIGDVDVDRRQHRHDQRRLHRHAVGRQRPARSRSTTRPPTAGRPRPATTPPRRGTAHLHARADRQADRRHRQRRHDCRDERDVHRQPVEPGERDRSPAPASAPARSPTTTRCPTLTIGDATANEGNSGTTSFDLHRHPVGRRAASTVTVDYATADGTAAAPGDYAAATGTLTFSPGPDRKADHRHGQRRHHVEPTRRSPSTSSNPDQRDHRRHRRRHRHDHQRRRAPHAVDRRAPTVTEGNCRDRQRRLRGDAVGARARAR